MKAQFGGGGAVGLNSLRFVNQCFSAVRIHKRSTVVYPHYLAIFLLFVLSPSLCIFRYTSRFGQLVQ